MTRVVRYPIDFSAHEHLIPEAERLLDAPMYLNGRLARMREAGEPVLIEMRGEKIIAGLLRWEIVPYLVFSERGAVLWRLMDGPWPAEAET